MTRRAVLLILDGFGAREEASDNAISLAKMPHYTQWKARGVANIVHTSGTHVGLPDGQMGNSEVGHINIGAGRVVKQNLIRINDAFESGELKHHPHLKAMAEQLSDQQTLHLVGLVSDGGVHSTMEHILGAAQLAASMGIERIALHALTDGRDTAPDSAPRFIAQLEAGLPEQAYIATLGGRFYAMDRDARWDRVEKAWSAIVEGKGPQADSAERAVSDAYARGETDEFITPTVIQSSPINDGDAVWFLNFRADRVRQFAAVLTKPDEEAGFQRKLPQLSSVIGMVKYRQDLTLKTLFEPLIPKHTIGEVVARHQLRQLRIAETEKYAHITYFFNGGSEAVFEGEDRVLIDSPKDVKTYDQKPEMSAPEVTDKLVDALVRETYDLVVCNYANPDMVGHTGNLEAAVSAMRALDDCLGRVLQAAHDHGYGVLISADHGNIEQMRTKEGKPHTQHTTGPVPIILIGMGAQSVRSGALSDLAPTLLDFMELEQPDDMAGRSLLVRP